MTVTSALRATALATAMLLEACASGNIGRQLRGFEPSGAFGERARVIATRDGVIATIVAPDRLDFRKRIDLILYALPNGNSTAQTMGRKLEAGMDWHYDIQHIGAQTRALRESGISQAVVVYLEADNKSWPEWRRVRGYEQANRRIVAIVDEIRESIGSPPHLLVTLTGHSGGGSLMFGFIEAQQTLPDWLERIAFLDSNYNFEPQHGEKIANWLRRDAHHTLVVLAYDDRNIMLNGKKVVSDSGGTWRASQRMIQYFQTDSPLPQSGLSAFIRYSRPQIEILLHPNPENRILHTGMIGEMNGYMHALLAGRPGYALRNSVLKAKRAYEPWIEHDRH